MAELYTFRLSKRDVIRVYSKSIIGLGQILFLNREVEKKDLDFIEAIYRVGMRNTQSAPKIKPKRGLNF